MFSILRIFAEIIMKLMSNKVTNNGIYEKNTHTPKHQDCAATLMDTSGYFLTALNSLIYAIIFFSRIPSIVGNNSEY